MGGRRIKTFFFFFLLFSIPWGLHRDVPVALAVLVEQPGVGPAGGGRDGACQATPADDLHLLRRGGVGVGERSQCGQSQIPAPTLHPPLPQLPPAWVRWAAQGAHRHGVAGGRHVPECVFNKMFAGRCCTAVARAMPTSRKQAAAPALSRQHTWEGDAGAASPPGTLSPGPSAHP